MVRYKLMKIEVEKDETADIPEESIVTRIISSPKYLLEDPKNWSSCFRNIRNYLFHVFTTILTEDIHQGMISSTLVSSMVLQKLFFTPSKITTIFLQYPKYKEMNKQLLQKFCTCNPL